MEIYVFGNQDLAFDSLPLRLIPKLTARFPDDSFLVRDPNEEWEFSGPFVVLDTVVGIEVPKIFKNLSSFQEAPRMTCHDFDAYSNLRWLEKIGRLPKLVIVGVPPTLKEDVALAEVSALLERARVALAEED